jgi:hypothetical protein
MSATTLEAPTLTYPALHTAASAASKAGRIGHTRLVMIDLALLAVAALIGVALQAVPLLDERWVRVVAAVVLAVALLAKLASRLRAYDAEWFDGRAVAETVKSATWRYVMHATPYDGDDAGADATFAETLRETIAARPALGGHLHQIPADGQQITSSMRQLRALPVPEQQRRYLSARVGDQIRWYSSKAAENARQAMRWFWIGFAAQGAALVLAIAIVPAPNLPDLVGGLAALAAVAAAWTQYGRHDELSKSYGLAAQELAFLRSTVDAAQNEDALRAAVAATEDAISREHTMWMARRG